ncbi:hypothetical protein [Nocardioides sp. WS12]|uniref:hypothetical protein n=1 Tax=Nocardioides sp. WS12 TaxID=2486272 RepID=UPI0015F9723D|nr:hypothetical protein [Nocardioides sp. WS12]
MAPPERRQERERRARRLWRHYQPPTPDEVEPEVDAQQPWAAYRRREPAAPAPATATAAARAQAAAAKAAERAANQAAVEAGDKVLRNMVFKLFTFAALLGGVAVVGNLDGFSGQATESSHEGPDPRTAEGIEHLSDLLEAAVGDDQVVAATLRDDGASLSVPSGSGARDVTVYSWSRWDPDELSLFYSSTDSGTAFDLGDFDAAAFAPLLSAARDRRGVGVDEGELVLHHLAESPVWVEVTVDDDNGSGDTDHATFDGELVSPD